VVTVVVLVVVVVVVVVVTGMHWDPKYSWIWQKRLQSSPELINLSLRRRTAFNSDPAF
jgi:hypothetical protein